MNLVRNLKFAFCAVAVCVAAVAISASFYSCSSKSSDPSPLIAQSERLAGELGELVYNSPMYLDSVNVDYSEGRLSIGIGFSDPIVNVNSYGQPLVEFVVSQYMKSHNTSDVVEIINALLDEKGKFVVSLYDRHGNTKAFEIPAARMKKLLELKPMELNYSEVRTNVCDLLDERCALYKNAYKADSVEFDFIGGFAQYTLTFKTASTFSNLNQNSLRGRYQNILREQYDNYGACRPIIEDLLKEMKIDGYKFVYTDESDSKVLRAAVPWKII